MIVQMRVFVASVELVQVDAALGLVLAEVLVARVHEPPAKVDVRRPVPQDVGVGKNLAK
jgi:hypothetical protein